MTDRQSPEDPFQNNPWSTRDDAWAPRSRGEASPNVSGEASPNVSGEASPNVSGEASPNVSGGSSTAATSQSWGNPAWQDEPTRVFPAGSTSSMGGTTQSATADPSSSSWQSGGGRAPTDSTASTADGSTATATATTPRRGLRIGAVTLIAAMAAGVGGLSGWAVSSSTSSSSASSTAAIAAPTATVTTVAQANGSSPNWTATAKAVADSVVSITVSGSSGEEEGSGVILDTQGHIVTNNHVVSSATSGGTITVSIKDKVYSATVVGTDSSTDLAVIKLTNPPSTLHPMAFADSSALTVGQPVMAIGNPLGLSGSVTTGIISALNRPVTTQDTSSQDSTEGSNGFGPGTGSNGQGSSGSSTTSSNVVVTNAIQTSAPINPGNSGGALVNASGQLIGINSSIASLSSSSSSSQSGSIGIGFAIPANLVRSIANQLISTGKASHALLGVTTTDASATDSSGVKTLGAGVQTVSSGSAADKAGLKSGDVIVSLDGTDVTSGESLVALIRQHAAGDTVSLVVLRNGSESTIKVTLDKASS
ncbi:S1C family serine protease [Acidipropionibacterium timonense]|uniref:S1C family serine protease n=1 Tax=Acidipropionibacterium timonense TaxID=2161818 RepID=UPI001FD94FCB|nr:trypsin-like peptidase domain-containing protein [Acidipropionibacterium timonense]